MLKQKLQCHVIQVFMSYIFSNNFAKWKAVLQYEVEKSKRIMFENDRATTLLNFIIFHYISFY